MSTLASGTVTSTDGTVIAYDTQGDGPALVVVDGAFCHRTFGPSPTLAPLLADHFTVYTYDRRGRGDSTDTAPYDVERELDDLRALIGATGGSAHVLGISSGGILALRAAAAGLPISKLAVYEPPLVTENGRGHRPPPDAAEQLAAMIADDRRGRAVKFYLTQIIGAPAPAYYALRLMPTWPKMKAVAPSLPHDAAVFTESASTDQFARIDVPTLAISGARSPASMRAAVVAVADAVPRAEQRVLPGQSHNVSTAALAPVVREFLAPATATPAA